MTLNFTISSRKLMKRLTASLLWAMLLGGIALPSPTQAQTTMDVLETRMTIQSRSISLEEVIDEIQRKTGLEFVYDKQIGLKRKISLDVKNGTVSQIVKQAFDQVNLSVEYFNGYMVVTTKEVASINLTGKKIQGTVVSASDKEPIIGATVVVIGTPRAATTDVNGTFSFTLPAGAKLLEISYVGMKKQVVRITPNAPMEIALEEDYTKIDDVVVIGYGQQAKRDITGAIVSISSEDIDNNAGGDINSALQGKIPGMLILSNSGEPGAGSTISIRGASSLSGSNSPLYIIDGVPIEGDNITSIEGDATFSPIAGLNPAEIASVEVLKDAASSAIYGSRAANGVIIITTKGGNSLLPSDPTVTVTHTSSIVSLSRKLDVMTANQFREAIADACINNGQDLPTSDWFTNPTHPYFLRTTDWQDVIFRPAYQTKNDINVKGSTNNFSYSISLGYRNLKPIVEGTKYEQYNARTNFTYKITKRLIGGTNVFFSKIDHNRVITDVNNDRGALKAALFTNPAYYPYDPYTGELRVWLGADRSSRNPLAMAVMAPLNFKSLQLTANQYFKYSILNNLELRVAVSADLNRLQQSSFMPKDFDNNVTESARRDYSKFSQNENATLRNENTLTYTFKRRGHQLTALLGQETMTYNSENILLNGSFYVDDQVTPIQNASQFNSIQQNNSERVMLSFFGRLNYNYKSRYIVSLTFRRDGSSRFGKNKRYGNFPSASVGWRFSDENFMKFARKVLSDGKLRFSYGQTGNQSVGNYTWQGVYAANSQRYDGTVTISHDGLANYNLGWETTTQYNAGIDLSFFDGRILTSADVYLKQSKDLLFDFPLPSYTGFSSVSTNFGAMENRGVEFLLNTVNLKGKFRWNTSFNIYLNRNKITRLPNGEDVIVGSYSLASEGQPSGVFFGYKALGVYSKSSDNVYTAPDGTQRPYVKGSIDGEPFKGGDMIWYDATGDGIINDDDRVIIGNPHPKFSGGFGNTFSYQNFTLNVFFNFVYGNQIMNGLRRERNKLTYTNNLGTDALGRWRQEGDVTDFPMLRKGDIMENFRVSDFNLEDGSFLRLKEITLSYKFPTSLCKRIALKSLRVYVSATNLLTWSNYSGYDPEVNSSTNPFVLGVDNGAFPKSRSFNLGVELTF